MASTHIEIKGDTRLGAELRQIVDSLQAVQDNIVNAKKVYDQLAYGNDFTALGAALGLTGGTAATDAETIYNLIGSVVGEQDSATSTAQFLSRLG